MVTSASSRLPPQDIETEKALLGTLMINQGAMYETADVVHWILFTLRNTASSSTQCSPYTLKENPLTS